MRETLEFPVDKICYVMTDFTESNFAWWSEHPQLKPYFDSGQLDSAIFDAVVDSTITLSHSGVVLSPDSVINPICIVANYLFDTLCHDIFQVVPVPEGQSGTGMLKEGLVSVGSKRSEEADPLSPDIIKRLDNHFRYDEVGDDYYNNEDGDEVHFERILHWYRDYFGCAATTEGSTGASPASSDRSGASILIPIGALRALRRLTRFSSGRCLVVSGDKGNNNPEQFRGLMDPHIAVHGSFSVMVNYHAIGAYFTSRGGFALHNPQEEASLKVSTFVLTGEDDTAPADEARMKGANVSEWTGDKIEARNQRRVKKFPHLAEAFSDSIEQFGPNDFFVMQKAMKEDAPTPSLKAVVALLKLSDHDPDVFYKVSEKIPELRCKEPAFMKT